MFIELVKLIDNKETPFIVNTISIVSVSPKKTGLGCIILIDKIGTKTVTNNYEDLIEKLEVKRVRAETEIAAERVEPDNDQQTLF